ncbi:MAG: penicillin acylase family protein [Gemmatimonadetes bacterium]|nr:penicillin acylase family protein [Gemmatimonadota bacterium]
MRMTTRSNGPRGRATTPFFVSLAPCLALALVAIDAGAQTATIHRDAWGVPHVLSDTDRGAVLGMAWALAEDDWPLIEENYLHALGRYAELVGEEGVSDDWMARALEIVARSRAEYDRTSAELRDLLDAFAAGMNAWLAARPDDEIRVLRRIEPWYPLALIRYKYYQNEFLGYAGLRGAWVDRLIGSATGESPQYHERQFDALGRRHQGSNQWAIAPSRTAEGHALLLINPHQSFVGVQRYAEIHLDSREGLRFSGLTVFGFALPYMGHNDALGWAYTDNYADHSDLWAIRFDDPANPLAYRYGDGVRMAEAWTDSLRVKTANGLETRAFRFRKTHHGPIVGIGPEGHPLAVRLARMEEGGWLAQWEAMIRARSLDEWREAVSMLRVPYMNTMYADRDGHIGYIYNSAVPRRGPGVDPSGILDGSDPSTEWQGFHDLDELPQVFDPANGWVLNTNSTPFTAAPDLPFDRSDFPAYMVGDESDNPRARSSRRILESIDDVTFDEFATLVWDTYLSGAETLVPALAEEWESIDAGTVAAPAGPSPGSDAWREVARVVARLKAWAPTADASSVETTWLHLMAEWVGGRDPSATDEPILVASLAAGLDALRREWGTIDVEWGRINRHQRPLPGAPRRLDPDRPSLPIDGASGGLGSVFSYYSGPARTAAPRLGLGGNSFVKVVEFGPEPRAGSILNYGQSGDPASPHFFDQASLYAERRFKPAFFTRADVEANAVRSYAVGPEGRVP